MLDHTRSWRIAALCIVLTSAPAQALEKRATIPVPLKVSASDSTRLTAGTTETAALAGRRLYLTIDFDPTTQAKVPIALTMTAFGAAGQVRTHLGMFFDIVQGRLETSIYVPDNATSFYWTLSGAGALQEKPSLIIRAAQTYVSATKFRPTQMCTPCRQYLDEAMRRVRQEFLFADRLPLEELEAGLRLAATGAQDIREMDGPLKELSRKLAEAEGAAGMRPHGRYQTKAEFALNVSPVPVSQAQQFERQADAPLFDSELLGNRVGYIRLRNFLESNFGAGRTYARALREAIVSLHGRGADQWIFDLREHGGGTLFPAIAALRPLLGKGAVGYFVDAGGNRDGAWLWGDLSAPIEAAGAYFNDQDLAFDGEKQAAAILVGGSTASTGEMVAIAFHGRSNSRSFGTPTAGYTTAVAGAPDRFGNFLGITSKYTADRNGQRIFPQVVPDAGGEADGAHPDQPDPVLRAAITWLGAQH